MVVLRIILVDLFFFWKDERSGKRKCLDMKRFLKGDEKKGGNVLDDINNFKLFPPLFSTQ